jgi:hypothetical protein
VKKRVWGKGAKRGRYLDRGRDLNPTELTYYSGIIINAAFT